MKSSPEVHGHAAANEAGPIDGVSKMLVCLGSAETALCMEVTIPPSDTFPLRQDICSGRGVIYFGRNLQLSGDICIQSSSYNSQAFPFVSVFSNMNISALHPDRITAPQCGIGPFSPVLHS